MRSRSSGAGTIVSVVIPAYNSAATLGETLASVRSQTHRELDIIVVNDGSSDATGEIARRHAAEDARIRVLDTANGGVAAARNAGIAAAAGELVAPVDADDLWRPEKIARQIAVLEAGGGDMGYVYTGFCRIDMAGRVISSGPRAFYEGHVYLRSLVTNFVGNGSSLLIRRRAVEEIGGYDPELRLQGVEGAEDRLVQSLMARRWRVGAVPALLTGYRQTAGAMSADAVRMYRSQLLYLDLVFARFPETPGEVMEAARAELETRMAISLLKRRAAGGALAALGSAALRSPESASAVLASEVSRRSGLRLRRLAMRLGCSRDPLPTPAERPDFQLMALGDVPAQPPRVLRRLLDRLERLEAGFHAGEHEVPGPAAEAHPA